MIYIGLDDTDNKTSRGTGRLARSVAAVLAGGYRVSGVTRHQLLVDPRVPYTSHNSSNTIHLHEDGDVDLIALADSVQAIMLADFQEGSDPGLCVSKSATPEVISFARRAKVELVFQAEARSIAADCGCVLRGLGGTQDGVIGALAGVGLAATGEDGRFVLVGRSRDLMGVQPVEEILAYGIGQVQTIEGTILAKGLVDTGGKLRPAFRGHRSVLVVQPSQADPTIWQPVKLN